MIEWLNDSMIQFFNDSIPHIPRALIQVTTHDIVR